MKEGVFADHSPEDGDTRRDGHPGGTSGTPGATPSGAAARERSFAPLLESRVSDKATLEVRPVYHDRDDTTIGHIAERFLAPCLEVDVQLLSTRAGARVPWPDPMRDLA